MNDTELLILVFGTGWRKEAARALGVSVWMMHAIAAGRRSLGRRRLAVLIRVLERRPKYLRDSLAISFIEQRRECEEQITRSRLALVEAERMLAARKVARQELLALRKSRNKPRKRY